MSQGTGLFYGVIEDKGAYNKHATIPAAGAALASRFLEKAVQRVTLRC